VTIIYMLAAGVVAWFVLNIVIGWIVDMWWQYRSWVFLAAAAVGVAYLYKLGMSMTGIVAVVIVAGFAVFLASCRP
jgi:hypothetical protein